MSDRRLTLLAGMAGIIAVAFLVLFLSIREGSDVAKKKEDKLCEAAQAQIAAKDYAGAIETCLKIQPLNAAMAHAIRGKAYDCDGRVDEAIAEYDASYANGNHIAGGSAAFLRKQKATKP